MYDKINFIIRINEVLYKNYNLCSYLNEIFKSF